MMNDGRTGILLGCIIAMVEGLRFTLEPENIVVALSQPLWWHCHAVDDNGIVTYSWLQGDRYLPIRTSQSIYSNGTLYMDKVESYDVGNFTCVAKSGSQKLSSDAASLEFAYVYPTFTTNPASQTALLGDEVILQCQIESLPSAEITWTLNGQNVTKDTITMTAEGESTLRLYPVMYPDAGSYKCEGRNPLLNIVIYSDVGEVVVEGPPVFTSSLRSVSVPLGLKATFDCQFDGNPEPTVAWFIHRQHADGNVTSREITTSDKYRVYPNGTFQIFYVTKEDIAFYTCRVANNFGQMSDSAVLNITGNPTLPLFTVSPSDQTVIEGGNVTFTCQAEGNPTPIVTWLREGKELASVDGKITVTNAQTSDAGIYVCAAENDVGFTNRIAKLDVLVGPSFVTTPEDVTVLQGSHVSLSCEATGNPTPNITWTAPENLNSSLEENGISVSADGSLVINHAQRKHHGVYTCTATNEVGLLSANSQLTVEAPPVFTILPVSLGVQVKERAMFHCQASGYPTPSMYWSKDGEGMITSTAQRQVYLNHSLVIHSVKSGDRGVYRCQAYNTQGSIEAPASLTVIVPPYFTVGPTSQKVRVGDDVTLDCIATGDPVPTQKWNKDGGLMLLEENIELLQNYTLVIHAIRAHQFGEYVCVASNMAASISASARIQTEDFPILTIRPTSITVNMSETARLQCQGQALEVPSTHWFRLTGMGAQAVKINERITLTADGEMIIQNLQPSDEGWYQCIVANSVGNVSENVFIKVQEPPRITHTNSPQTTVIYSYVTLTCQSTGDPPPVLHWINPNGQEVVGSASYIIQDNILQIVSASQDTDGGNWVCRACNLLGCDESDVEVRIEGPPAIHSINASRTGDSVILDCLTSGEPQPSVTFTYSDEDVTLNLQGHKVVGNSLHIDGTNVKPSYVCVAENRNGEAQATVSVPSTIPPPMVETTVSREIAVIWSAPDNLGGLPLLGYQLEATSDLGETWQRSDILFSSTNGSLTGLAPFTYYEVRVAGVNILGIGVFSDLSEMVRTSADAPSPPTSVVVKKKDDSSIFLSWNHSEFLNGDIDDVDYRYKVSILPQVQTYSEEEKVSSQSGINQTETVYHSGSLSANQTLKVTVEGLTDPVVYSVTVWAVNVQVNKSSEPVIVFADLTITASVPITFSPDTIIGMAFGIVGGIILILVIVFIATQIRHMKKTESISLVNHQLSLDKFYMENPKNLYGKSSRFSMKRSSSQGFYKFDNDESFHGSGSVSKENGSALKEKHEDGDVLLTARNPLYDAEFKDQPLESSGVASPEPFDKTAHQSFEQAEIEIPRSELQENFVLKPAADEKNVTGSDVRDTKNIGIDDHAIETDSDTDLAEIYSISKETDDSHIYEIPNLETRSHTSKENSPPPSTVSNNSKARPVRVLALEQLRGSSPLSSSSRSKQAPSRVKVPDSPLDSPTDEKLGDPEREVLNVQEIPESSFGEQTDLLPHKNSTVVTKRNLTPPKDIRITYDISDKDIKDDLWSAALY